MTISERIAQELGVRTRQVEAAVALLDEGATVPFIARYRKEATGSLDEVQIRAVEERQAYLNGLIASEHRATVLSFDALMSSAGGVVAQPALGRVAHPAAAPEAR